MQPALHAGQVMQRYTARLRRSVGALWPTLSAHTRLCVNVYMGVFTCIQPLSPKFNLTSYTYISTVSLGLTAYLIPQEVKNDEVYI